MKLEPSFFGEMVDMETTKCVKCLKPAICWTGHVVAYGGKKILAGWCKKHEFTDIASKDGCFGPWREFYGAKIVVL